MSIQDRPFGWNSIWNRVSCVDIESTTHQEIGSIKRKLWERPTVEKAVLLFDYEAEVLIINLSFARKVDV